MFKDKNHFELFDLPLSFFLDLDVLEHFYRKLNQQFHPDVAAQKSSREKLEATLITAQINDAYETLKNPLKRGLYLLKYLDPQPEDHHEKTIKDPELLLDVLENQEALSCAQTPREIEVLLQQGEAKKSGAFVHIEKAFKEKDFSQARLNLYRYRYYDKLIVDATDKLRNYATTA